MKFPKISGEKSSNGNKKTRSTDNRHDLSKDDALYGNQDAQFSSIYKRNRTDLLFGENNRYILPIGAVIGVLLVSYVIGLALQMIDTFTQWHPGWTAMQWTLYIDFVFPYVPLPIFGNVSIVSIGMVMLAISLYGYFTYRDSMAAKQFVNDDLVAFNPELHRRIFDPEDLASRFEAIPDRNYSSKTTAHGTIISHFFFSTPTRTMVDSVKVFRSRSTNEKGVAGWDLELETDDKGELVWSKQPLFDVDSARVNAGLTASREPEYVSSEAKKRIDDLMIDPTNLKYRGGKTLLEVAKVDFVNKAHVPGRPTGVYLVDNEPQNVYVVGITRSGKGATRVENQVDAWIREFKPNNAVINDPKGEIAAHTAQWAMMFGIDVQILNLEPASKSVQFNPLTPAIQFLRRDQLDEFGAEVGALVDTYFPGSKSGEQFWIDGPRIEFTLQIYLLMSIMLDEETWFRKKNEGRMDQAEIDSGVDTIWSKGVLSTTSTMVTDWGGVTVNNRYDDWMPSGVDLPPNVDPADFDKTSLLVSKLDLMIESQNRLPRNPLRTMVLNQSRTLQSMAKSEKTMSSIVGIAATKLVAFNEPTFRRVTTASPREALDVSTWSHPRQFLFRFAPIYAATNRLDVMKIRITAYHDPEFKNAYEGKGFSSTVGIRQTGWVIWPVSGKFDEQLTYFKLEVIEPRTQQVVYTHHAEFTWGYQRQTGGRQFVVDNNGRRIVKDGTIRIGSLDEHGKFNRTQVKAPIGRGVKVFPIDRSEAKYRVQPTFLYVVAGPQVGGRMRVAFLLISAIFWANYKNATSLGKPDALTRYMLDEAGNLTYDGVGLNRIETLFSIGQASGNQFTFILQTMEQMTEVYGQSIDAILDANTSTVVYIRSSEATLLDKLSKKLGVQPMQEIQGRQISITDQYQKTDVGNATTYSVGYDNSRQIFPPTRLQNLTVNESVISSLNNQDNDGNAVRPGDIYNHGATSEPRWYIQHKFGFMRHMAASADDIFRNQRTLTDAELNAMNPDYESIFERFTTMANPIYIQRANQSFNSSHGLPIDSDPYHSAYNDQTIGEELLISLNIIYDDIVKRNQVGVTTPTKLEAPQTIQAPSAVETQQPDDMMMVVEEDDDDAQATDGDAIIAKQNEQLLKGDTSFSDFSEEVEEDDGEEIIEDSIQLSDEEVSALSLVYNNNQNSINYNNPAFDRGVELGEADNRKAEMMKDQKIYCHGNFSKSDFSYGDVFRQAVQASLKLCTINDGLASEHYQYRYKGTDGYPTIYADGEAFATYATVNDSAGAVIEQTWSVTHAGLDYLLNNPDSWDVSAKQGQFEAMFIQEFNRLANK